MYTEELLLPDPSLDLKSEFFDGTTIPDYVIVRSVTTKEIEAGEFGKPFIQKDEDDSDIDTLTVSLDAEVSIIGDKSELPVHNARRMIDAQRKSGALVHPKMLFCVYCGAQADDYHHWGGYESGFELAVFPACRQCHRIEHT